jgi:hypothetical protein
LIEVVHAAVKRLVDGQPRFTLPGATIAVRFAVGFTLGARGVIARAFHPIEQRNRVMTAPHVARLNGRDPLLSELSPAGHKVLGLLQKGSGYHVLGAWRFRGLRSHVKERTIVSLLEKGLAERIETDQHLEVRITPVGRSANQKSPRREVDPIHGTTGRWITAARSANAAASERLLDVSSGFRPRGKS